MPSLRALRHHAALAAVVAPAMLLPLACEDSSGSSSGGTFNPGAGPGFDAGPTSEGGSLLDGALPDAPTTPKGVTVTVRTDGVLASGVRVIFHDATGAVTSQAVTDATGKVAIAIAPSMVTVLTMSGALPTPVTFMGVTDGDNLQVGRPTVSTPAGSFSVGCAQQDLLTTVGDSFVVVAGKGCGGSASASDARANVPLDSDCVVANNAILTTISLTGNVISFGFLKNVAPPVGQAAVAVDVLTFAAPGTTRVTASNLPAGDVTNDAYLLAIANEQSTQLLHGTGSLVTGGFAFPSPTGYADAYQAVVRSRSNTTGGQLALARREATTAPATATLAALDFATALPLITAATVARPTPARPDVTITAGAGFATADAGFVTLGSYFAPTDTDAKWLFVVPPATTSFKVPALPADATDFVPSDPSVHVASAVYFESSLVPSFQAVKTAPIAPDSTPLAASYLGALPAAGTVRVSLR